MTHLLFCFSSSVQLVEIESELYVRDLHHRMVTGESLFDADSSHPRVRYLLARKQQLTRDKERLEREKVYRPDMTQVCVHILVRSGQSV